MPTDEIAAVFGRLADGFARLDAAALAANYAKDCVVESPIAGELLGREAVERAYRVIFSAFPDFTMQTEELLIFGNRVVQTARFQGIDNGGFTGLPPTGKRFSTSTIFNTNEEIVHERRVYDFSRMLLQLAGDAGPSDRGPKTLSRDAGTGAGRA
jgi:predicted ester cyclase